MHKAWKYRLDLTRRVQYGLTAKDNCSTSRVTKVTIKNDR